MADNRSYAISELFPTGLLDCMFGAFQKKPFGVGVPEARLNCNFFFSHILARLAHQSKTFTQLADWVLMLWYVQ